MYVYKLAVVALLAGITVAYTNCGRPGELKWQSSFIEAAPGSLEAFESTVYPLTRMNCASCHETQAPKHASDSVQEAHDEVLHSQKVNFGNIASSRLVRKLRDENHNCWGDCDANATEMEAAIKEWYAAIQSSGDGDPSPGYSNPGGGTGFLKTSQTLPIAQELANTNNPSKSNTVEVPVATAMVNSPMVKASDSYGNYIYVPDDGTNATLANNDPTAGIAMMNLRIPAAGSYRVWAYLLNPDANSNAVFLGLAPMGTTNYIGNLRTVDNIAQNANPMWRQLSGTFNVTAAGDYTLTIRERKDGLKIYRLFVTADTTFNGNDVASYLGVTLSFDISQITNVPGTRFLIDVSDYDMYTYLLANPRIATTSQNIRVKNVRLMVNNVFNPQNSTFTAVDKVATPEDGLLSGFPMIVLKDKGPSQDRIHIEFEILESYNGTVDNTSLIAFQNSLYRVTTMNCANCHSAQRPHASPDPLTAHDYSLTIVNFDNPANSLIVREIRNGHQGVNTGIAAQLEAAIIEWRTGRNQ